MKAKPKGKELLKVAAVSALAVGMFSAAFMGVNRLAFASATNDATTLEIEAAPFTTQEIDYVMQDVRDESEIETAVFTPPTVTFVTHTPQEVPSHAISKEEALLIGAEYIWDVLGGCIDGMYVEMTYIMMPGFTRPFWIGSVTTEKPPNLDFADFEDDLQGWMEAQVFTSYFFRLDALTGMRVDVSYMDPSHLETSARQPRDSREEVLRPISPYDTPSTPEEERAMRNMEFMSSWFEMSTDEQLEFSDMTSERLEAYTQTALGLAQRHFNHTTVESMQLGDAWDNSSTFFMERIEDDGAGGNIVIVSSVAFTAIDQTGREAIIRVPTENASWQLISVGTMHNEFIPGFSYEGDGVG